MSIEMTVIIAFASAAGLAAVYRTIAVASVYSLNDIRGRWKRIKYVKKMKKGIKECNYKTFRDAIYDIKNYDIKFEKSYFNTLKQKYNFSDVEVESRSEFYKRFNKDGTKKNTFEDILDYIDLQYNNLKIKI
jgi:hypothetical protein